MNNLLHTWSLSAEEQFYLVLPWVLLFLYRLSAARAWPLRGLVAVVALVGIVPLQMSGLRMGTLLAGAALGALMPQLVAHVERRWILLAAALSTLGLLCLMRIASHGWWQSDLAVPVLTAAVVAGAALLEWRRPLIVFVLKPAVWGGRVSYGLYLWHLPLYFILPIGMSPLKRTAMVAAATVVMAAASWYLVERPISRKFGPCLRVSM